MWQTGSDWEGNLDDLLINKQYFNEAIDIFWKCNAIEFTITEIYPADLLSRVKRIRLSVPLRSSGNWFVENYAPNTFQRSFAKEKQDADIRMLNKITSHLRKCPQLSELTLELGLEKYFYMDLENGRCRAPSPRLLVLCKAIGLSNNYYRPQMATELHLTASEGRVSPTWLLSMEQQALAALREGERENKR